MTTMGRTEAEALRWLDRVAPVRLERAAERSDLGRVFFEATFLEMAEAKRAEWWELGDRLWRLAFDLAYPPDP